MKNSKLFQLSFMLLVGLLISTAGTAQRKISGIVEDATTNLPLGGATISLKSSKANAVADTRGRFDLEIPGGEVVLVVSFVGYNTQNLVVGEGETNVVVKLMQSSNSQLSQVVVVGYGTQKKEDVTGAISTISGSQINSQAIINPVQALTGLASGVQTLQNSGEPGNTFNVLVRGDNSILGGNSPLFVVDGFPYDGPLSNINPNNIKSIEVLKDASATAIYGSRGSNGVVIIQTKSGIQGKTTIEYDAYYGLQQVTKKLDLLDAKQFATLANVRAANDGVAPFFTQAQIDSFGVGTNWQDAIFRTAPIQNHSLTVSGGGKNTTFSLSGNYVNQQGIVLGSNYSQAQFMANLSNHISKNWKISFHGNFSTTQSNMLNSDNKERGLGVLSGALVVPPTLTPYNKDGSFTFVRPYAFSPDILENPVAMALETEDLNTDNSFISNIVLEGTIVPHLTLHESIGLQYDLSRVDYYSPTLFQQSASGTASTSYGENSHWVNENLLTYSNKIGQKSNITVLGGVTAEETVQQGVVASATGFANNILQNNSLQSGTNPGIPSSTYGKYTLLSWLGRAIYTYENRYVLSVSARGDGSSVFGASNKWGYFPSVSGAWRVSEQSFWGNLKKTIDNFKLRASWGESGNTAISPYQSLSLLSSVPTVFDKNLYIGFAPGSNEPNPNLKWETTSGIDIGTDIGLFNERVTATFDYYYKKTRNLLASTPVPPSSGYSSQSANIGSLQNKGFEISVNVHVINTTKFTWDLGGTITANRNKVLSLYAGAPIFGTAMGNALPAMSMVAVGQPIGVFYGLVEQGLNSTGNIKYKDLNGDGVINSSDRTVIGNPNPKYIFGINSNFTLGSFGLSFIINSSQGNNVLAYDLSSIANGFYFGENQLEGVLGHYWTANDPNPNAQYPVVSSLTRYQGSNRYIKNGSYVRLQNIQISYTPKGKIFGGKAINRLQIYLAGQNLVTLTHYPLFTPLNNTFGAGINKGIDMMGYPDARTLSLGLRISL
ncbi:MAG TPA: TonB-dependent receptor [Hanamia sp.]|nr:TonB-dependent receptor [Hanamia sp.]